MTTKFTVQIEDIRTDPKYYSFSFKVFINGKLVAKDKYDSDHSWGDEHKKFGKELRGGLAARYALERIF